MPTPSAPRSNTVPGVQNSATTDAPESHPQPNLGAEVLPKERGLVGAVRRWTNKFLGRTPGAAPDSQGDPNIYPLF